MAQIEPTINFRVVANFIHQLIHPLNAVSGTLSNLIDGTIQGTRRDQRLRAARGQLETAILLVKNLEYFSGLSLDPGSLNPGQTVQKCVIPQIIIEAAQFFQEIAEHKGMRIELTDRRTQYTIMRNSDLLRQVFMNMFDNGVKYGSRNSTLTVEPWVQKTTNDLLIRISGPSVGITPGEEKKLFDPGFRGSKARDHVSAGTGLGLYICKTIMEGVFNGSIEVEVATGDRAAFLLRFPGNFI